MGTWQNSTREGPCHMRIRFCHLVHLKATGVKFGVEEQVDMDNGEHVDIPIETTNAVPQLEQPVIPENFESERVTEEPAVVTPIAPTTPVVEEEVRHSSRVRQPTKRLIEEM